MNIVGNYQFPPDNDVRVLMMPYIQGDPTSLPDEIRGKGYDLLLATLLSSAAS